jgi:hypothetical protein
MTNHCIHLLTRLIAIPFMEIYQNPVTCINQSSQTVHRPTGDFRRSSRDTAKAPGRTVAACCAFTFAVR